MVQVEKDQAAAAEVQAVTAVEEQKAQSASAEANGIKTSVQKDLDEALPEYYAAIKALDSLNKQDITEVKSFTKPPPLVETVLAAVCLLMGGLILKLNLYCAILPCAKIQVLTYISYYCLKLRLLCPR